MNTNMLKTRDRMVRYSMPDFIAAVRAHPQLWGRHHPDYHNRDRREMAWHEVARRLFNKFDSSSPAEMQRIIVMLTKRWKNTRDSFFRGRRLNRIQREQDDEEPVRAYIYEQDMSFLLNSNEEEFATNDQIVTALGDNDDSLVTDNATDSKSIDLVEIKLERDDDMEDIHLKPHSAKKPRTSFSDASDMSKDPLTKILNGNEISEEYQELSTPVAEHSLTIETPKERAPAIASKTQKIPKERVASAGISASRETPKERAASAAGACKHASKVRVANATVSNKQSAQLAELPVTESDPDQSFFDSIKPVIRNMDMDQKLDFQIEVLKLLKNFRGKR